MKRTVGWEKDWEARVPSGRRDAAGKRFRCTKREVKDGGRHEWAALGRLDTDGHVE